MSNKKQTSIDWLVQQLARKYGEIQGLAFYYDHRDEIRQAKEIHKQELIDFADDYVDNCVIPNENMAIPTHMDVPEYYKTKFEK